MPPKEKIHAMPSRSWNLQTETSGDNELFQKVTKSVGITEDIHTPQLLILIIIAKSQCFGISAQKLQPPFLA